MKKKKKWGEMLHFDFPSLDNLEVKVEELSEKLKELEHNHIKHLSEDVKNLKKFVQDYFKN